MQELTQQPSLIRRPAVARLQIPELPNASCPFPWSSPCSIIHGFPDSPMQSPAPPTSSGNACAAAAAPPNHLTGPPAVDNHPTSNSACFVSDHLHNAVCSSTACPVLACIASINSISAKQLAASASDCLVSGNQAINNSDLVSPNHKPDCPGLVLPSSSANRHTSLNPNPQPLLWPHRLSHSGESANPIRSCYSVPASLLPTSSSDGCDAEGREADHLIQVGSFVFVRCNQSKWVLGQVRRCANAGVIVWAGSAQVMVNVPFSLLSTHMVLFSNSNSIHAQARRCRDSSLDDALAAAASMQGKVQFPPPFPYASSCPSSPVHTNICDTSVSFLADSYSEDNPNPNSSSKLSILSALYRAFCIVRPAHLSHRQLYIRPMAQKHIVYRNPSMNNGRNRSNTDHLPPLGDNTGGSSIDASLINNQLSLNTSQPYQKSTSIFDVDAKPSFIEPMDSSNCRSPCSNHTHWARNSIKAAPVVHEAALMRSVSLPPTRPKEPRCHGVVRTKDLYRQVVRTKEGVACQTEASFASSRSRENEASSEGVVPSRHEELIQGNSMQDDAVQNMSARRCKSLGLADKQVWHTVIENGLHTKNKKNLQENLYSFD